MSQDLLLGARTNATDVQEFLSLRYANRHGLVAGATGTGKTVTLQGLAEGFSKAGVPVFLADVKGDLSGFCEPSAKEDFLIKRAETIGFAPSFVPEAFPVAFWDMFGEKGLPMRTTISEMGPLLLSRILDLNDTQEGVLNIAFKMADEEGLLLLDMKDLRALLVSMSERTKEISAEYGNVTTASIGSIQRALLQVEEQGGEMFFGEPALSIIDFMRHDAQGRGTINVLNAAKIMATPKLYAVFLLWLMSELFEELPEVGDQEKPRLVFFFDEAHLLFSNAPKALLEKIEQVIKLIRSKGVGLYFITQNPANIPESVLAQLGNRIQHGLRAFTPQQQKDIREAAQTYRPNPEFDVEAVINELSVGEALISTLQEKGQPSIVQRVLIRPPLSKLGACSPEAVRFAINSSELFTKYQQSIDRESAYELLKKKAEMAALQAQRAQEEADMARTQKASAPRRSNRQTTGEAFVKSMIRTIGSQVGREIIRGVLGAMRR
ncbi:MAG: helicase HerA-like domain-containing protein [Pseudobdellovibrionaceae bacterium]